MNILTRFGRGSTLYTFPTGAQISYEDDFDKLANKIVKVPGANGGFRNSGSGRGQSIGGTVKAEVWLTFASITEAVDKVNTLHSMPEWGLQPLFRQPLYGAEQFCWAVFNSASLRQDVKAVPHIRQRIPVIFEVPDPFWHRTVSGFGILWGDGVAKWGDGTSKWGVTNSYAVTSSLTQSFTNSGNAYTLPRVKLVNSSGSSVTDIRVQRVVDGAPVDDFIYTGTLATGTYLDVDQARQRVSIGPVGTNALDDFSAKNPDWLKLVPGTNSIKVTCNGALTLIMTYLERIV